MRKEFNKGMGRREKRKGKMVKRSKKKNQGEGKVTLGTRKNWRGGGKEKGKEKKKTN